MFNLYMVEYFPKFFSIILRIFENFKVYFVILKYFQESIMHNLIFIFENDLNILLISFLNFNITYFKYSYIHYIDN